VPVTDETPVAQKTAVIAGNYRQFTDWCREHEVSPHSPQVIYATSQSLRGRRNVKVERTGTWYERDDLREIEHDLVLANVLV
jgi:hypothetical protein